MALTGLHVQFTYANDDGDRTPSALIGKPTGSSNVASGGVSAAAPINGMAGSSPVARLSAAEGGYYAIGTGTPSAATDPRGYLNAGDVQDVYVSTGDKIAWLTA